MSIKLFLALSFCACLMAADPNAKLAFNTKLLDNAKNYLLPRFIKKAETYAIPDFEDQTKVGFLTATVEMKNMKLTQVTVDIPNSGVTYDANFIVFTVKTLSLVFNGDFNVKLLISENGHLQATLKPTDVLIKLAYTNKNGFLSLTTNTIDLNLDFDFKISGSFGLDIINAITNLFKSKIVSTVKDKVSEALKKAIDVEGDKLLGGIPYPFVSKSGYTAEIDTTASGFNNGQFDLAFYGQSYVKDSDKPNYPKSSALPDLQVVDENEVIVIASDNFVNSISYGILKSQTIKTVVTNADIPPEKNIAFSTKALGYVFQNIDKVFNQDYEVQLGVNLNYPIDVSFQNDKIYFNASVNVDFNAVISPSNLKTFSTLKIVAGGELDLKVENFTVFPYVKDMEILDVSTNWTQNPIVPDVAGFKAFANLGAGLSIEFMNKFIFSKGIKIPSFKGISLKKINLKVENSFINLNVEPLFGAAFLEEFSIVEAVIDYFVDELKPSSLFKAFFRNPKLSKSFLE